MRNKYSLFFLRISHSVFTSCIKQEVTPLGDEGKTFEKFLVRKPRQRI